MAKAIHMMIRVLDEARSVDVLPKSVRTASPTAAFDGFTLVYLSMPKRRSRSS